MALSNSTDTSLVGRFITSFVSYRSVPNSTSRCLSSVFHRHERKLVEQTVQVPHVAKDCKMSQLNGQIKCNVIQIPHLISNCWPGYNARQINSKECPYLKNMPGKSLQLYTTTFTKEFHFRLKLVLLAEQRTSLYFCLLATWQHFSSLVQLNIPEMNSQTSRSWKNMRAKGWVFSTDIQSWLF